MTIPTEQDIKAQYQHAPKRVQDYVTSQELEDAFHEIRNINKLHLDEADKLSDAIVAVFLEMRPANEFPKLLREVLEKNGDKHAEVLKAVNEKIFVPFRKKLTEPEMQEEKSIEVTEPASIQKRESVLDKENIKTPVAPNRLEESVRKVPTEIEVKQQTEVLKEDVKKNTNYNASADPYREPIE